MHKVLLHKTIYKFKKLKLITIFSFSNLKPNYLFCLYPNANILSKTKIDKAFHPVRCK